MELLLAIFLALLTTAIAAQLSKRTGLSAGSWIEAAGALLDWAGLFSLFLGANMALGVFFVLVIRSVMPFFVSLYLLDNSVPLILSAVQAFLFLHWWKGARSSSAG
ncbi:MAG TPA: hypothetical protein VFU37_03390 [Pyrinomonadaceae bacterium]|nr:hypothetical protein [Pyrinomonadaceae bacterium]